MKRLFTGTICILLAFTLRAAQTGGIAYEDQLIQKYRNTLGVTTSYTAIKVVTTPSGEDFVFIINQK